MKCLGVDPGTLNMGFALLEDHPQGPTLIDRIYHPGHHADLSFRFAVNQGVRAHHWRFGDMPPVPNVTEQEVEQIICYVRELQRFHGIFEEEEYLTAC